MTRPPLLPLALIAALTASAASAQPAPSSPPVAPPEKIDPGPVRPDEPAPPAKPDDAPEAAEDPLGVAANVFAARIAAPWDTADGKGFSRVVGVIEGGRQRFYVQWLKEPDGAIVQTKELEDPEAAKLTFGDVRAEASDTGVTVFMDTSPDANGIRDTWVLIIGDPGDTRFGPATN